MKNELGFDNHPAERVGLFGHMDWLTTREWSPRVYFLFVVS
jgi:hypothetical protein